MITHTNLFADASNWIFYLAYLFSHTIELECSNFKQQCVRTMSLLAFQEASEYRFYHTDTLFALVKPIHKTPLPMISLTISVNLFETGIKVVDLLTPYKCGGKIDLFFSAGVGKTVLIMEFIRNIGSTDLYYEMQDSSIIEISLLQLRVSHGSISMGEYFRDAFTQDLLIFIDGSEVSTLLGRMPSAF